MTKKELQYIKKLLLRVKPQDEHVNKALSFITRSLAIYEAQCGQLKDQYEVDYRGY